jgi:hypothetical protein
MVLYRKISDEQSEYTENVGGHRHLVRIINGSEMREPLVEGRVKKNRKK